MPQGVSFRRVPFPLASPPVALTLVSAEYAEAMWVELGFDRAVDISAIVVDQIEVEDGPVSNAIWQGSGAATLVGPTVVRVPVTEFDPSSSSGTVLNATAATGIVAVDDGGTWAGVSELGLPFP